MLEFQQGVAEVGFGDFFAEDGVAELLEEDEADSAVLEFLVAGREGQGAVDVYPGGQGEGKLQRAQGFEQVSLLGGAESGMAPGEEESRAKPQAHGFAMQHFAVGQGGFDAVADGVAQVQEGTDAEDFFLILLHDAGFDGNVGCDDVGQLVNGGEGESEVDFICQFAEGVEHAGFADGGVLDHFGHTLADESRGEGGEGGGVDEHQAGLVESADEVFAGGDIYGSLATYGAIHLSHDAGGYLHKGDAAVIDAGQEPCHVAHHAASQGYHEGGAVVPGLYHFIGQGFDGAQVFAGFASGERMQAGGVAAFLQAGAHAPGIERAYVGISNDGGLAFEPRTAAKVTDGFQRTVLNMHFVRFRPQGQGDIRHASIITRHHPDASRYRVTCPCCVLNPGD